MTRLTRWLQGTNATSCKTSTHQLRNLIESLEDRAQPAGVTAQMVGTTLVVYGTDNADKIYIGPNGSNIQINDEYSNVFVKINGKNSIAASKVNKVEVYAKGGNDYVQMATNTGTLDKPAYLDLGKGRDTYFGGSKLNTYYDPEFAVTMHGVSMTDVNQEGSPTCQTLASLAEMVSRNIDPSKNIKAKGNNKYEVKLPGATTQTVTYNGTWNDNDPAPVEDGTTREIWPVLMHRARLQSLGVSYSGFKSTADWDADQKRTGNKLYSATDALKTFTGRNATSSAIGNNSAQGLQTAINRGDAVVLGSLPGNKKKDLTADGVARNHAYAVMGVYQSNGKWMVTLYNPWGTDRGDGRRVGPSGSTGASADDGIITLEWAAVQRSFADVYIAKK